jgi:hypothetical protein
VSKPFGCCGLTSLTCQRRRDRALGLMRWTTYDKNDITAGLGGEGGPSRVGFGGQAWSKKCRSSEARCGGGDVSRDMSPAGSDDAGGWRLGRRGCCRRGLGAVGARAARSGRARARARAWRAMRPPVGSASSSSSAPRGGRSQRSAHRSGSTRGPATCGCAPACLGQALAIAGPATCRATCRVPPRAVPAAVRAGCGAQRGADRRGSARTAGR